MNFAKWETLEEMKKNVPLVSVDKTRKVEKSGLPLGYDDNNLYIDSRSTHSLIIGATGSGKTQAITLPMLELARLSGESIVIHDVKNEIYEMTEKKFRESGYNVVKLDFDDSLNTNHWNPLDIAKKYYNDGNYDNVQEIVEDIGYYLLNDPNEKESDPFWINSATSYFTGICLYAIENEEALNLFKIYELTEEVRKTPKEFLDKLESTSAPYICLSGILNAPPETRESIFSVFNSRFRRFIVKNNLKELLSTTDFDLFNISKEKTIVYIKSGKSNTSNYLLPLFLNQIYNIKEDSSRLNIIVDDFYGLNRIKDFNKMLNYSRGIGIAFTIMIRGFNDLKNTYGNEESEIIKLSFGNIIYLLSLDINTIEEISRMCGNKSQNEPLISVEELKTIKTFEAIVLTTRMMPFKTKLLPYYEMKK